MKKVLSLILVLAMCLFLCACGSGNENTAEVKSETEEINQPLFKDPKQEAFEISKEAYERITAANEIIRNYAQDIYEAWAVAEYYSQEVMDNGCSFLAEKLPYMTEDDVRNGMAYLILPGLEEMEWDDISEERKEEFRINLSDNIFSYNQNRLLELCVEIVQSWYQLNGMLSDSQESLQSAKSLLKEMSADYSDYEYYLQLKDYYTSVSSFLELCNNPVGYSFEQMKITISEYNNEIRDYQNDLEFIFED